METEERDRDGDMPEGRTDSVEMSPAIPWTEKQTKEVMKKVIRRAEVSRVSLPRHAQAQASSPKKRDLSVLCFVHEIHANDE